MLEKLESGRYPENYGRKSQGKTIGEFSGKEWEELLGKVDSQTEAYREDLKFREQQAKEERKKQSVYPGITASRAFEQNPLMNNRIQAVDKYQQEKAQTEPDPFQKVTYHSGSVSEEAVKRLVGDRGGPYSAMADENGRIEYNGTVFECDNENNRLTLGEVSDYSKVVFVNLADGGTLVFNRDCVQQLLNAIDMFSPEDMNRIMQAIAQDAKLKQMLAKIEDESSGLEVMEGDEEASGTVLS